MEKVIKDAKAARIYQTKQSDAHAAKLNRANALLTLQVTELSDGIFAVNAKCDKLAAKHDN